jgi:hypothetical protein
VAAWLATRKVRHLGVVSTGQRKNANPRRRESELTVRIVCPECGLFMGVCLNQETADRAIGTHVLTLCKGPS